MEHGPEAADCDEFLSVQDAGTGSTDEPRVVDSANESRLVDSTDDTRICVAIVEAVSEVSGVEPCQLDTRLYDVVDPDALERIVRSGGPDVQVSFRFGAYRVSVFGDGEITVTEASVGSER